MNDNNIVSEDDIAFVFQTEAELMLEWQAQNKIGADSRSMYHHWFHILIRVQDKLEKAICICDIGGFEYPPTIAELRNWLALSKEMRWM